MIQNVQIEGIETVVQPDAEQASRTVAQLIADQIGRKGDSVLGLATGGTPVQTYRQLIEMNRRGEVDFSAVTSFNLDEYIGLDGAHPQSFRAFMNEHLFDHVNIDRARTFVPDGCADDVEAHCAKYESMIDAAGGIDLQLLGLGHNGHIAFNEPGSPRDSRTRRVDLTPLTIQQNARFFDSVDEVPCHAITMGIATILGARRIVMLATGGGKSEAVARMLQGPIGEDHPASLLRHHDHVTVVLDRAAAAELHLE
ncbi:glucosamine-6-phosphate deaminase [Stieleria mannarensis]|uniref:glucosamine-6-phosphate deaminase n=1 Tax=Stieleria mannarensis TaxID=2755585 RepID=UPI001602A4E6|nr:glucosamine-6-phosphate deaminase [Rhodopirellula sp. JC639]